MQIAQHDSSTPTNIPPRTHDHDALRARWATHREAYPQHRIRQSAEALGVREAQLLATQLGESVVRLRADVSALFEGFQTLGTVMASTRNEWAVIEKTGEYDAVEIGAHVGLVLNEAIDLRIFPTRIASAYAVEKQHAGQTLRSVQLFDAAGDSVHKVYLKGRQASAAQLAAFDALVATLRHEDQTSAQRVTTRTAPPSPADEVDVSAFQQAWLALEDTHHFFGMLRSFHVTRQQALAIAPEGHALLLADDTPTRLLEAAAARGVPIMAFVGNPGCIEIHSGPIRTVRGRGDWINVLDPAFNLHLNTTGIAQVWLVRKPTTDGIVTSLEVFAEDGTLILQLFGVRKPGIPEDPRWRDLIAHCAGSTFCSG